MYHDYISHHFTGMSSDVNGSISRSIPAHGLNGGVFPRSPDTALFSNKLSPVSANTPQSLTNGLLTSPATAPNGKSPVMNGHNTINGTCTSSNGYYGFQPASNQSGTHVNGQSDIRTNGHVDQSEDCDMETDAAPVHDGCNGSTNNHTNGSESGVSNGHTTGLQPTPSNCHTDKTTFGFTNGHVNGTVLGFTNGHASGSTPKMSNGHTNGITNGHNTSGNVFKNGLHSGEDITLNPGICQNHIPIAGCKRSREEGMVHEAKRMRTDGKAASVSLTDSPCHGNFHLGVVFVGFERFI